jgi:hypothetical protein
VDDIAIVTMINREIILAVILMAFSTVVGKHLGGCCGAPFAKPERVLVRKGCPVCPKLHAKLPCASSGGCSVSIWATQRPSHWSHNDSAATSA